MLVDSSGPPPPGLVDTSSSGADAGLQGGQPSPVDSSSSAPTAPGTSSSQPERMRLVDWWILPGHFSILPNRLYWLLGADAIGSQGEHEWYTLLELLQLVAPHWSQDRSPGSSAGGSDASLASAPAHAAPRYGTAAAPLLVNRRAAHFVVRWCVILAICRDAVARDPVLLQVGHRLIFMARCGACTADVELVEQWQVYLINKLHDRVYEMVDGLLNEP